MPFNGTGMFVRVRNWVADAAAGVKIRADYHDIEDDGFADGLSHCIAKDGQTVITQNIPMNGKRLTSLQDPSDPQDAATRAYADLMLRLTGGTITGSLDVTGPIGALGYKTRTGMSGSFAGNYFNFNWTGDLEAWVDNTNLGALSTKAYADLTAINQAAAYAAPKVNRSGDTMTGGLTVNGEFVVAQNYVRFGSSGGAGFIRWQGGNTYDLGGSVIWSTANLNPIQNGRWIDAGQVQLGAGWNTKGNSYSITALYKDSSAYFPITYAQWHYLQLLTPGGWFTVG